MLSNYQAEIPMYFVPDKEIVLFESIQDLTEKIAYYLVHEDRRKEIARNGYKKVKGQWRR